MQSNERTGELKTLYKILPFIKTHEKLHKNNVNVSFTFYTSFHASVALLFMSPPFRVG